MKSSNKIKRGTAFKVMAETLKAASHPERLAILNLLWSSGCKPMNVKGIYEALRLEQSVVSKHLGILKRCGLLLNERNGNTMFYLLNLDNHITHSMIHCLKES